MENKQKSMRAEADAEARRIIGTYPRKEVKIETCSDARDMSAGISDYESYIVPFDKIRKGEPLCPNLGFTVTDVAEDSLTLYWKEMQQEYGVKFGETVTTKPRTAGTESFPGEIWYNFTFEEVSLEKKMFRILGEVSDYHARLDPFPSQVPETTLKEMISLRLLDEVIKEGNIGLYPLKAQLMASNDWAAGIIVRDSLFRQILLEGIEKGCLAPDDEQGWEWIETVAETNDPEIFMDDMERWYDILASAMENGNEIARDIMDRIWEPEQIIEED